MLKVMFEQQSNIFRQFFAAFKSQNKLRHNLYILVCSYFYKSIVIVTHVCEMIYFSAVFPCSSEFVV